MLTTLLHLHKPKVHVELFALELKASSKAGEKSLFFWAAVWASTGSARPKKPLPRAVLGHPRSGSTSSRCTARFWTQKPTFHPTLLLGDAPAAPPKVLGGNWVEMG